VCVFSFSGPRVGNTRFKARLERELGVYVHVGADLSLDHRVSPYLKAETLDLVCFHNLEAHLHLLDGYQGRGREFRLCGRDPALVTSSGTSTWQGRPTNFMGPWASKTLRQYTH